MLTNSIKIFLCFLIGIASISHANPTHVLVRAREQGQGLLFKRFDECYLLTAGHVTARSTRATLIGAGSRPLLGQADLVATFPNYDLALLRASGPVAQECQSELSALNTSIDSIVNRQGEGVLSYVYDDGGMARTRFVVVDTGPEFLRLSPQRKEDSIAQGQSGGLVSISDRPAGILLSVDSSGTGKAMRFDFAVRTIERFFVEPSLGVLPSSMSSEKPSIKVAKAGNLLSAKQGAQAVFWNTPPAQPEMSASSLLGGASDNQWIGQIRVDGPIDIDFSLNANQAHTLNQVELEQSLSVDPTQRVKDFELFVSSDRRSWRSIASGTLITSELQKTISIAPIRASFLRLRIYSNWGDKKLVTLRSVAAY